MSEAVIEQGQAVRTKVNKTMWTRLGVQFILSAINVFLLLVVTPKFVQIFQDALPGKPLPAVTNLVISMYGTIAAVTALWPIIGAVMIVRKAPFTGLYLNLISFWLFLQIGTMVIALFMPMCGGVITEIPDHS